MSEAAATDAIFTADVGTPTVWAARYLAMNGKRRLIGSFNHGSMANALPQAIGAQAAFPGRQVVSLSGDGGFSMLMGDFISLTQLGLPVKVIVYDNGVLGFVAMEQQAGGFLDTSIDLRNPDFAAMANAMGVKGLRVEQSADLEPALQEAFAHPGPALVDVLTAKQELVMPPKIQLEEAKGFSLFMLKAIINGRGDEVIALAETILPLNVGLAFQPPRRNGQETCADGCPYPLALQKSACSAAASSSSSGPTTSVGALAGPEHDLAWQVEGRVLLVRPGLRFQPLLALAVDDPADPRPVDRAGAHRAGLGRSVEGAAGEEGKIIGAGGARGEQALGVGGAVAALAGIAVALLHHEIPLGVREHRAERMVAGLARTARDVEGAAQQRLVIGAKGCHAGSSPKRRSANA